MDHATLLLGCYRKSDCDDPEVFATAAVAVMSRYPEDVVRKVTDPYSGLPATSKWVPTIAELREACETANNAAKRLVEQDARVKAQLAERARMEAMEPAERRKAFISNWRAKQAAREAATAGIETPLADMDARGLQGEHKALVTKAIEAKIAAFTASSASTPVKLSDACLRSLGLLPDTSQGERVA